MFNGYVVFSIFLNRMGYPEINISLKCDCMCAEGFRLNTLDITLKIRSVIDYCDITVSVGILGKVIVNVKVLFMKTYNSS